MCTCTYRKNILVANVKFGRSCLDLLSTDQQTGNRLALSFVITFKWICSERTFKVHSRKVWKRNLRGIQVLIFGTTRLKVFVFNFLQSFLFWDDCITKRLTLASVRELDYLKLVEWKHNYFLQKDFYPLRHSDVYRISLNHLATRKVLKPFLFSQPWYFGTLWLWKVNCKKTWFISRALNYTLYSCCTQFCYLPT